MKILIAGLTGTGKSTVAKEVAGHLGLEYISGSAILRTMLGKPAFQSWESQNGIEMIKARIQKPTADKKTDAELLSIATKKDNIVIDSWTIPWLYKNNDAIKVYLTADFKERVKRVQVRDKIDEATAAKFVKQKDELTAKLYKKIYKIDIFKPEGFHLVIDTTREDPAVISEIIARYALNYVR